MTFVLTDEWLSLVGLLQGQQMIIERRQSQRRRIDETGVAKDADI